MPMRDSRIQEERADGILRVVIGPRRNLVNAMFGSVFAGLLIYGLGVVVFVLGGLISGRLHLPPRSPILLIVFITAWAIGVGAIATLGTLNWLLGLWGRWEIAVTDRTLTKTAQLFSIRRSRSFAIGDIANVRINERRGRGTIVFRTIMFDCDGEGVHVTPALSRKEARQLIEGPLRDLGRS
jgi:hypothetical protein